MLINQFCIPCHSNWIQEAQSFHHLVIVVAVWLWKKQWLVVIVVVVFVGVLVVVVEFVAEEAGDYDGKEKTVREKERRVMAGTIVQHMALETILRYYNIVQLTKRLVYEGALCCIIWGMAVVVVVVVAG